MTFPLPAVVAISDASAQSRLRRSTPDSSPAAARKAEGSAQASPPSRACRKVFDGHPNGNAVDIKSLAQRPLAARKRGVLRIVRAPEAGRCGFVHTRLLD